MSKLAICMSGLPRNIVLCRNSIKRNLLNKNDHDLYGFFWSKDVDGRDYSKELKVLEATYKFKNLKIESQYDLTEEMIQRCNVTGKRRKIIQADKRRNVVYMWKAIQECNRLKANDKYEVICKFRTDISTRTPTTFEKIQPGVFYTVGEDFWTRRLGLQDIAFYGSENVMDQICNFYDHIQDVHHLTWGKPHPETHRNMYFSPHLLLEEYVKYLGFSHEHVSKDYRLRRPRPFETWGIDESLPTDSNKP